MVSNHRRAIGVFHRRQEAEQALSELKASGFPMDKVSIIAIDAEEKDRIGGAEMSHHIGDTNVASATGVVADTLTGSALGGVLVGLGSLAIPGLGPVIAAGTVGLALVTSVAGVGLGAAATSNLVKALADLGIPSEQATTYGEHLNRGNYLVIVESTAEEISRAEAIFSNQGIQDWGVYESSQS